jgi:hypothetical protein
MTDENSPALDSTDAGDAPANAESLDRLREAAEATEQAAKVYGSHPDSVREAPAEITARKAADEETGSRCWLPRCAPQRRHYKHSRRGK